MSFVGFTLAYFCSTSTLLVLPFGCGQWKAAAPRFSSVARIGLPGIEELSNSHVCLARNKVKQRDWTIRNTENNSSSVSYWRRGPDLVLVSFRFVSKKCHKFINYDGWLCGQHWTLQVSSFFFERVLREFEGAEPSWDVPPAQIDSCQCQEPEKVQMVQSDMYKQLLN